MTKQVMHQFYDAKKREYFLHIQAIAAFIAARLQYQSPECNENMPVSTIRIDQHKEKFGDVRIYCTLADAELVRCMWKIRHTQLPRPTMPDTFKDECWLHDARHYRRCYRDMVSLVPHYKDAIINAADHYELLYDDVDKLSTLDVDHRTYLCRRHECATLEQLIEKLNSVYTTKQGSIS